MLNIGQRIKTLREEKGMTQEELAKKVGYKSRASINKIELQRDLPLKKIVPIANALDITPQELMGWSDNLTDDNAELLADVLTDSRLLEICRQWMTFDEGTKQAAYEAWKPIGSLLARSNSTND